MLFPWGLVVRALAVVAVLASLAYGWHRFTGHYIAEGVAKEHVHTVAEQKRADDAVAKNAELAQDVSALQLKVAQANKAVADAQADEAKREAASAALLAAYKVREQSLRAQLAELITTARGAPAATPEEACLEADRTLSDLADHRLRQ